MNYLKPEYDEEDLDDNDYEADSVSTASASEVSERDELVETGDLPDVIQDDYNTLMTLDDQGLIHDKSNKKIIIPSKSSYEMKFNVPQSKHTRIIEIKADYDQYLQMNDVFLEPHERKLTKTIFNDSDNSVCFHEGLAVIDVIDDENVAGYEFLNTLESLPELSNNLKKDSKPLDLTKLAMFPECEKELMTTSSIGKMELQQK
ncbi:hypothetical protein INT46_008671 [Mucor plumbeus]|uniref:Uncharacterized protein n=1 Tax=Mucor plumbeus TaxID=97098 RepID=A0A8H7QQ59_9FUNG|nr:hypothetical protein INT46_008671 [Mucor plumbeus]